MEPTKGKAVRFIAYLTGCACLAVSVLACSKAPADSSADTAATIRQQEAASLKAIGNRQFDATLSYYGDGALLLAPNAPIARTQEEIRQTRAQIFASVPAGVAFSGETTKVEVARSGDLGYVMRTYAFTKPAIDKGKWVDVLKKRADGSWKEVIEIFNSDLPASPPAR
jgi:ketosteroid isomerase-like protein